jgi:hypothetical protein
MFSGMPDMVETERFRFQSKVKHPYFCYVLSEIHLLGFNFHF